MFNLIDYLKGFGDSTFIGRPYKISRLLFLFFSLIIVGCVAYILYFNPHHYIYSECPKGSIDSCLNSAYGSSMCKTDEVKDLPVCTNERIYISKDSGINYLGEKPPWYIENYTYCVLGLYFILLIINTFLFNRHLFHKPLPDEPKKEDFIQRIIIDAKGGTLEVDNSKVKNVEGIGSNKAVSSNSPVESVNTRDKSEVKPSEASDVKTGLESDGKPPGSKAGSRFRKGNNNDGVPPSN